MLRVISGLLVILWLLGWAYHVGGNYIHLLFVLAATLFIAHLATLEKSKSELVSRARRVVIQSPIHFRKLGDADWWVGITENISRTGVLFETEHVMVPSTPIEMTFEIAEPVLGLIGAVICKGYIVRTALPPFGNGAHLAAKILARELRAPQ